MLVTDIIWEDKRFPGKKRRGYYMDEYLAMNLMGIPDYLSKSFDVVGIVSGHGKVRAGKSTIAQQIAFFIAWMLAGGKMLQDPGTKKWYPGIKAHKKIHFTIEENIVFTPYDLKTKARELYEKYGRNQVIVYDEGRAGLDSAAAMSSINRAMTDFFQECGQYGHVILIVLPNFFRLHEDYAISRSIFLIDVFTSKSMQRGFFNFYNELQKEVLYLNGRKRTGTKSKYGSIPPSFSGRFSPFLPLDKEQYENAKANALKNKEDLKKEIAYKEHRDAAIYVLNKKFLLNTEEIAKVISDACSEPIIPGQVSIALRHARQKIERRTELPG